MGWRGYIDEPRRTVFFWSQKAACTTLFTILADNIDPPPTAKNHFHRASSAYPKCLAALRENGFSSVIIVRDPVTRIISAYLNKFCIYRDSILHDRADLEVFAQALLDEHRAHHGLTDTANTITFEQFLAAIARMQAAKPDARRPINGHWETQMPPFLAAEGFRHDRILRVETLDADMAALAADMGLRYTARRLNRTERASAPAADYLGAVPACKVAEHAFDYGNFISSDTLAEIRRLYAVDFDCFGYDPQAWQATAQLSSQLTATA